MSGNASTRKRLRHTLPTRYGEDFAASLDGRFRLSREVRRRLDALVSDLGGESALSHAQRSLCRRAIWLELMVEHEESRISEGQGVDIAPHVALVNSLLQVYKTLGLKRQAKQEVSLSAYLQAHAEASETPRSEAKNHGRGD